VLDVIAGERNMSRAAVDDALFADLKENYRITAFRTVAAPGLVDGYETAQNQAVLLRATSVTVKLQCPDADGYRAFFRALKFRRLLYRLAREPDARYRIDIDGPFSLFQAVTKYGLQLALMLPALERAGEWELEADVRWGKKREPLRFELSGSANRARAGEAPPLPDEVAVLRERFAALDTEWSVEVADEVLDLPGEGLCVPDLAFTHEPSGACAYLEVMGYWSRDAVWRRVELVEAGLPHHIIFAVSSRLRVSEEVLDGDLPGQLYVYKGVISARAVHERLERLIGSDTPNTG
jgi:hypothetical protein